MRNEASHYWSIIPCLHQPSRGLKATRTEQSPDSVVLLGQFILVFWATGPGPLIIVFMVEQSAIHNQEYDYYCSKERNPLL